MFKILKSEFFKTVLKSLSKAISFMKNSSNLLLKWFYDLWYILPDLEKLKTAVKKQTIPNKEAL
ncbi:hypothetical protein LZ24_02258 [Desulfobotulus alkaliphilus]|uniref:Uncharacterized protein n=1 Tax=Desulfobotulus alkaliphilus TaxID=622671 RepID=A0A562RNP5_9BACT|nr:hypothetical protein LZ24_02258 [Desulfobotulus alkaliphilus]